MRFSLWLWSNWSLRGTLGWPVVKMMPLDHAFESGDGVDDYDVN